MKKLTVAFLLFWAMQAGVFATSPSRGPSVEPLIEVDIENPKKLDNVAGYDFNQPVTRAPSQVKVRVPANIVTKSSNSSAFSYLGPFIFLITLPVALMIMVSKKFKIHAEKKVDYYPKTHQFKGHASHHAAGDEQDDIDYPKAS